MIPRRADVAACWRHLRRHQRVRRDVCARREQDFSLVHRLIRGLIFRGLPWTTPLLTAALASGRLTESLASKDAEMFITVLGLVPVLGLRVVLLGQRARAASEFERLRMPSREGLWVARSLRLLPLVLAHGLALWVATRLGSEASTLPWDGPALLAGCLVVPLSIWLAGGARRLAGEPLLSWAPLDLLMTLLSIVLVLATQPWLARPFLYPFRYFGHDVDLHTPGVIGWTALSLSAISALNVCGTLRELASAERRPEPGGRPARSDAAAGRRRAWPVRHVPARSRPLADAAVCWAIHVARRRRAGCLTKRLLRDLGALLPTLWNVGAPVYVLKFVRPHTAFMPALEPVREYFDGVPLLAVLVGLVLIPPRGVGLNRRIWLWGCDYRVQARADTWLFLLAAWTPRAVGTVLAVVWLGVSPEMVVTAALLLAAGLPVVGRPARLVWRPWRDAPWWLKAGTLLALVVGPFVTGGLPLQGAIALGAVLGIAGTASVAWSLLGLPEDELARARRREA